MLGKLFKFAGSIFWAAVVVVVLFGVGIWVLRKSQGLPVIGPVAGAVANFGDGDK